MKALEKRKISRAGFETTFLGFGSLEIGRDWGIGGESDRLAPPESVASEVLNKALDLGLNVIDTASAYQKSEERIGKFLASRREEYILSSKCGEHNSPDGIATYYDFSYEAVKKSIDNSLELLKTDCIDIMFIHFSFGPTADRDNAEVIEKGDAVRAMKEARQEGKIKYLGASIDDELAKRCILSGDFDFMQMNYNLLDRSNEENIRLCGQNGIGVYTRTSLAMGRLTSRVKLMGDSDYDGREKVEQILKLTNGDYRMLTAIALRFLYENRDISSILVGTKDADQIEDNMRLLETGLDPAILKKAIEITAR